ncbi:MAG: 16S rRNA (adenine(1518)-N(6)/adenine(1519)-N(6))-dimethyltransferase RsmA, partial [Parasporobacterium sp.]|nr:16S rRNA (adenine(1518)-N(6)/adenine(1519)-N(6))-dimethyltransferase RsmA [Parasporobacterium sp.]
MEHLSVSKYKELISSHDFAIQKKYGQNFLTDANILKGIVAAAAIGPEDTVLEIGPGMGALTGYLLEAAGHVVAVEIDRMLIPILKETLGEPENLTLINGDILKTDLRAILGPFTEGGRRVKVVANLPYYITTPIVMELLTEQELIESITVMVQKEVADRMEVGPGSKTYGALSLAVQYYASPKVVLNVSKNCFMPRPDVDSAVIKLDIYKEEERPVKASDEKKLFAVIRAAFNQRRKTLVNALGNAG